LRGFSHRRGHLLTVYQQNWHSMAGICALVLFGSFHFSNPALVRHKVLATLQALGEVYRLGKES